MRTRTVTKVEAAEADLARYRAEFRAALRGGTYLNAAANGPLPRPALKAFREGIERLADPRRQDQRDSFRVPEAVRAKVARLVGADPAEIGLVSSTSHGMNLVARGLGVGPGDAVLLWRGDFPSAVRPWLATGAEPVYLGDAETPPTAEAVAEAVRRNDRIRAASFSWVNFATGAAIDLPAVACACREARVLLAVDGTQAVGVLPLDVRAAGVPAVMGSSQKFLCGPTGTGYLYVAADAPASVRASFVGWLSAVEPDGRFQGLTDFDRPLAEDGRRFEMGSPPIPALSALAASLDLLLEARPQRIAAHVGALLARLRAGLASLGCRVRGAHGSPLPPPGGGRGVGVRGVLPPSPILSFFAPEGRDTEDLQRYLVRSGVACSFREGAVRVSPHLYNSSNDIDRLLRAARLGLAVA